MWLERLLTAYTLLLLRLFEVPLARLEEIWQAQIYKAYARVEARREKSGRFMLVSFEKIRRR